MLSISDSVKAHDQSLIIWKGDFYKKFLSVIMNDEVLSHVKLIPRLEN